MNSLSNVIGNSEPRLLERKTVDKCKVEEIQYFYNILLQLHSNFNRIIKVVLGKSIGDSIEKALTENMEEQER